MYGIIYKVENKVNGKVYIGQTIYGLNKRKLEHINDHRYNSILTKAIRKYGRDNFKWDVIDEADNQDVLNMLERLHISRYESLTIQWGYNIQEGGSNGKHSDETKRKISKNHAHISGKNHPHYGKVGKDHPMYGKHHSSESKEKLRQFNIGKIQSLKQRKNSSDSHVGKYPGAQLDKRKNPEKKCYRSTIKIKGYITSLGYYEDPISASIVYKLVKDEIYREVR
jgi:group I intron endonuclease